MSVISQGPEFVVFKMPRGLPLGGPWQVLGMLVRLELSQSFQHHLIPPNLGSQTLRLQRIPSIFVILGRASTRMRNY